MKKIFTFFVLVLCVHLGFSQIAVESHVTENKWRLGGGLGLNFGNNGYFSFNISPHVGYMLAPNLETGVSAGYQYGKSDFFKSNNFSFGPYANYYIVSGLFARAHYEYYTGNQENLTTNQKWNLDESALWLGAGYSTSGPIRFQAGILYNVLYDDGNSIFRSPIRPFSGITISL